MRNININFPFRESSKGFYVDLTDTDKRAIKADLMHLILTTKGERYYLPDFGTNLQKFIFEQNDGVSETAIRDDISAAVKKYLPNLVINDVIVDRESEGDYTALVKIDYTITEDAFRSQDYVIIQL